MASLSIQERKRLRQIGHTLNPVVMIGGQGLTENVIEETTRALADHELIKVKVAGEDREARQTAIAAIAEATDASEELQEALLAKSSRYKCGHSGAVLLLTDFTPEEVSPFDNKQPNEF